jgi:hypothetical protein
LLADNDFCGAIRWQDTSVKHGLVPASRMESGNDNSWLKRAKDESENKIYLTGGSRFRVTIMNL